MTQNLDQWQLAIDENENYIKLGKAMQQRGKGILNSIPITGKNVINLKSGIDISGIAKLMDAATKAIERGAGLESKARENLRRLYACKPVNPRCGNRGAYKLHGSTFQKPHCVLPAGHQDDHLGPDDATWKNARLIED